MSVAMLSSSSSSSCNKVPHPPSNVYNGGMRRGHHSGKPATSSSNTTTISKGEGKGGRAAAVAGGGGRGGGMHKTPCPPPLHRDRFNTLGGVRERLLGTKKGGKTKNKTILSSSSSSSSGAATYGIEEKHVKTSNNVDKTAWMRGRHPPGGMATLGYEDDDDKVVREVALGNSSENHGILASDTTVMHVVEEGEQALNRHHDSPVNSLTSNPQQQQQQQHQKQEDHQEDQHYAMERTSIDVVEANRRAIMVYGPEERESARDLANKEWREALEMQIRERQAAKEAEKLKYKSEDERIINSNTGGILSQINNSISGNRATNEEITSVTNDLSPRRAVSTTEDNVSQRHNSSPLRHSLNNNSTPTVVNHIPVRRAHAGAYAAIELDVEKENAKLSARLKHQQDILEQIAEREARKRAEADAIRVEEEHLEACIERERNEMIAIALKEREAAKLKQELHDKENINMANKQRISLEKKRSDIKQSILSNVESQDILTHQQHYNDDIIATVLNSQSERKEELPLKRVESPFQPSRDLARSPPQAFATESSRSSSPQCQHTHEGSLPRNTDTTIIGHGPVPSIRSSDECINGDHENNDMKNKSNSNRHSIWHGHQQEEVGATNQLEFRGVRQARSGVVYFEAKEKDVIVMQLNSIKQSLIAKQRDIEQRMHQGAIDAQQPRFRMFHNNEHSS